MNSRPSHCSTALQQDYHQEHFQTLIDWVFCFPVKGESSAPHLQVGVEDILLKACRFRLTPSESVLLGTTLRSGRALQIIFVKVGLSDFWVTSNSGYSMIYDSLVLEVGRVCICARRGAHVSYLLAAHPHLQM